MDARKPLRESHEPTGLPDRTAEPVPANEVFDGNDDLSDAQRAHLHREMVESIRERRAGAPTFDADDVLTELASRS